MENEAETTLALGSGGGTCESRANGTPVDGGGEALSNNLTLWRKQQQVFSLNDSHCGILASVENDESVSPKVLN